MPAPPPREPRSPETLPSGEKPGEETEDLARLVREKARNSKRVAWLLDECIRVPGTSIKFGLDPLVGLLPYGGETVATLVGAVILGDAGRRGIPFRTLLRMGGNMILNAGVGTLPVIGDLFSFWFKSNSRNHRLLTRFLESDEGREAEGGWWPLLVVIGVIGTVVALNVLGWILAIALVTWLMSGAAESWPF